MSSDDTTVPTVLEQLYTPKSRCDCYECVGARYKQHDNGHRSIKNNLKHHTQLEPCDNCGRPKTEYKDLGRKGYYTCWWCEKRAAGPGPLEGDQ